MDHAFLFLHSASVRRILVALLAVRIALPLMIGGRAAWGGSLVKADGDTLGRLSRVKCTDALWVGAQESPAEPGINPGANLRRARIRPQGRATAYAGDNRIR